MAKAIAVKGKRGGGAVVKWEEELAREATEAAEAEQTPSGQFISFRGGQMSIAGQNVKGNEIDVVILDHCYENNFYKGKFDPDTPQSPDCFALARVETALTPHEKVTEKEHEQCAGCPQNVFGSADTGRGKACANRRRLAVISANQLSSSSVKEQEIFYIRVPVTSVKGWSYFVKGLAAAYKRPPHGVITTVNLVPDKKSQFRVTFTAKEAVDGDIIPAIKARRAEVQEQLMFPYGSVDPNATKREAPKKQRGAKRKFKA